MTLSNCLDFSFRRGIILSSFWSACPAAAVMVNRNEPLVREVMMMMIADGFLPGGAAAERLDVTTRTDQRVRIERCAVSVSLRTEARNSG